MVTWALRSLLVVCVMMLPKVILLPANQRQAVLGITAGQQGARRVVCRKQQQQMPVMMICLIEYTMIFHGV
jgi:hypothetical protein